MIQKLLMLDPTDNGAKNDYQNECASTWLMHLTQNSSSTMQGIASEPYELKNQNSIYQQNSK